MEATPTRQAVMAAMLEHSPHVRHMCSRPLTGRPPTDWTVALALLCGFPKWGLVGQVGGIFKLSLDI